MFLVVFVSVIVVMIFIVLVQESGNNTSKTHFHYPYPRDYVWVCEEGPHEIDPVEVGRDSNREAACSVHGKKLTELRRCSLG
ncbi:MAG: hypothetical protein A3A30_04960 [Candidatus Terrybacteria bacterium RIFCSPLOWO2_01_FULL_48_14]|nr:MAG: hypothetical protein A3A30_04960 [Candidatus Terrybacteria bacterium RIFCSPLOWO2_01_FULL_48_14]